MNATAIPSFDPSLPRCWWPDGYAKADPRMVEYHDREWAIPVDDDVALFERFCLEVFEAGLSWALMLRKREGFRAAFAGFDPAAVAAFTERDAERLMADTAIVRNRRKVEATIVNARAWLELGAAEGSVARFLAARTELPVPRRPPSDRLADVPGATPAAERLSRELASRGFAFVGPRIVYAFMQSVGMVDDHLAGCHRYRGA